MTKFESQIGSRNVPSSMREFNVPDDSGSQPRPTHTFDTSPPVFDNNVMRDFESRMQAPPPQIREISDFEKQVLEAKKLKREGKERLSEGARRRVEMLVGMSRLTKECELGGNLYKLQTLTSKDLREVVVAASEFDGTVQLVFETRKQILARSLIVVAGVDINQFLNSNELSAKLDFIEELDHALLLRLYNEYISLAQEVEEKYSLKTDNDVKEVLEDLKK